MHKRSPCANVFRRACKSKPRACVTYIITTPHPMRKRMCLSTQQAWNCIDGSTRFVCKLSYNRCRSSPRSEDCLPRTFQKMWILWFSGKNIKCQICGFPDYSHFADFSQNLNFFISQEHSCFNVCMYVCMHACIYLYMNVWMNECMYVCMYVLMTLRRSLLIFNWSRLAKLARCLGESTILWFLEGYLAPPPPRKTNKI